MKKCSKCGEIKELGEFYKNKKAIDGVTWYCKNCQKENSLKNRLNKEDKKEYNKQYYIENKEKVVVQKKIYNEANRDKRNARERTKHHKIKNDIQYRLKRNLRARINKFVKGKNKSGSAVSDIGCAFDFFINYLQQLFQPGMTYENYGAWHIDHIIPLVTFDLTDKEQFIKASHYTNLQPLWEVDNLRKGKKIINVERK